MHKQNTIHIFQFHWAAYKYNYHSYMHNKKLNIKTNIIKFITIQ